VGQPSDIFCAACFTGDYPMPVQLEMDKLQLETLPMTSARSLSEIET
jgi:amidophosphoribosyltransferase